MSRTYKVKVFKTYKQKNLQKYNHNVIRQMINYSLKKIDIHNYDEVIIPNLKFGINPSDILDFERNEFQLKKYILQTLVKEGFLI